LERMDGNEPRPSAGEVARWEANFQAERAGAELLRTLAEAERRAAARTPGRLVRALVLERLAEAEARQADYWAAKLAAAGAAIPALKPSWRDRLLLTLARRFGTRAVLPLVAADALRRVGVYEGQPDAAPVVASELTVARDLAQLTRDERRAAQSMLPHHRSVAANGSLRAAVFGVNDGLVSNLSLVMGVAGAAPDSQWILLSGLAGMLAGALSMAGGEFVSMLSQRELFEKQLALEREHIRTMPELERANLARIYQAKGLAPEQAEAVATQLLADPDTALDTIAREQLGLDPEELGSPRAAAIASFLSFAAGAALPILPFLFVHGTLAVLLSFAVSALGLFVVGVLVSYFTARNPLLSGLRMTAIGLGAALVTYLIGRLIGVSVVG
jgi:VIT1/CCC1 family predicted Fe2+/Mn2+ transporter